MAPHSRIGKSRGGPFKGKSQSYSEKIDAITKDLKEQVENGFLLKGKLRVNAHNPAEAYAGVGLARDVVIVGDRNRGLAMHDDEVAIELHKPVFWRMLGPLENEKNADQESKGTDSVSEGMQNLNLEIGSDAAAIDLDLSRPVFDISAHEGGLTPEQTDLLERLRCTTHASRRQYIEKSRVLPLDVYQAHIRPDGVACGMVGGKWCELRVTAIVKGLLDVSTRPTNFVGMLKPYVEQKNKKEKNKRVEAFDTWALFCPTDERYPKMVVPVKEILAGGRLPSGERSEPMMIQDVERNLVQVTLPPGVYTNRVSQYFVASFAQSIGPAGDFDAEQRANAIETDLPSDGFSAEIMASIPVSKVGNNNANAGKNKISSDSSSSSSSSSSDSWAVPESEWSARLDLTKTRICTIDPPTAKDLDDALSCRKIEKNTDKFHSSGYEVGVHIADVTHFVRPDSKLDIEAKSRATTVYMVDRSVPMLPRILSEDVCSLHPCVNRLAFSCIWRLDDQGRILDTWFGKTVIRSVCKLDYETAYMMIESHDLANHPDFSTNEELQQRRQVLEENLKEIESKSKDNEHPVVKFEAGHPGKHTFDQIRKDVVHLDHLARIMRARRFDSGSLSLDRTKITFELDENNRPVSFKPYQIKFSNKLVEEFMLLANQSVARHLYKVYPKRAMLRRHDSPNAEGLEEIRALCQELGLPLAVSSAGALHRSLEEIGSGRAVHGPWDEDVIRAKYLSEKSEPEGENSPSLEKLLVLGREEKKRQGKRRLMALYALLMKPMQLAKYVCSGAHEDESLSHYALNFDLYTHFTSPIRRYADVVVHRLLEASLQVPLKSAPYKSAAVIEDIASHCNTQKTKADKAQERSDVLFLCTVLRDNKKKGIHDNVYDGMIIQMDKGWCDVTIPDLGLERRVSWGNAKGANGKPSYQYNEKAMVVQVGWKIERQACVRTFGMFDDVRVVATVDPEKRPLDVECYLVLPTPDKVAEWTKVHAEEMEALFSASDKFRNFGQDEDEEGEGRVRKKKGKGRRGKRGAKRKG